jgi:hypothetical protein
LAIESAPHPSFVGDIVAGAFQGDFAPQLGVAGYATQIVCAFIPGIGALCALRDFFADRRKHDRVGMLLNGLALIPFLGGFPKTAAVLRSVRHIGHVIHKTHTLLQHDSPYASGSPLERHA